jgi:hypothetical protein
MKTLTLAAALTLAVTTATAADLFGGLSVDTETHVSYTTGTETWAANFTPSVGWGMYGLDMSVATTVDLMGLDEDEIFNGLDFKAEYELLSTGIMTYGKVSSDADFNFGNVTVGAKLSF